VLRHNACSGGYPNEVAAANERVRRVEWNACDNHLQRHADLARRAATPKKP